MSRLNIILSNLTMEVPLLLYMLSSFLKYPVFQNLIYEKVCLNLYNDHHLCKNVTAYYEDKNIHEQANHVYFLSSVTLLSPSIIMTLFLGAACDIGSTKIPLIIPFVGLILSSVVYIVQAANMEWNVYLLLISDAMFGFCGGYIGVIGTTMAYSVKATSQQYRSIRIALMEGSIGLGGTIGFALSGTLRSSIGYTWSFLIQMICQVIAFLYIITFAKELNENQNEEEIHGQEIGSGKFTRFLARILEILYEFYALIIRRREFQTLLWLCLGALGLELLVFAGLMDIQYSFLRYKLGWGDKEYGWFSGLSYGTTTAAVMIIYPHLKLKGWTDSLLGSLGIFLKTISLCVFAFISAPWMAYTVTVLTIGNRFVSTGFRAFISTLVDENEQGKVFSLIVFLEGVTSLAATTIYNNLYPKTLPIFPGMMILISASLLLPCLGTLLYGNVTIRKSRARYENESETPTNSTE